MRFVSLVLILSLFTLVGLGKPVRADNWIIQRPVVYRSYYAAAPVTYYHSCHPVYASQPMVYGPRAYAPQTYSQQPYGSSQRRGMGVAPARPTTTATVGAFDNYFEPKTINVQPGTTVRWVNRGEHAHTVTANDDRWDSGDIAPGASYTATFQAPGAYYYYCRHHTDDKMQGTIVVGSAGRGSYGGGAGREGAGASGGRVNGYGSGGARASGSAPAAGGGRSGY